jgi:hypothetical protein
VSDDLGTRLSRWSQRKAAARRGGALPAEADETRAQNAPVPDAQPAPQPAAVLEASDAASGAAPSSGADIPALPPIEQLTFQSDYTVFMAKNVPEALRRAALRKLWASDPVLANLDGLNDYCEDLNLIDTPITAAQTAYRAGIGYLDEVEEKLAQLEQARTGGVPLEPAADALGGDKTDASSHSGGNEEASDPAPGRLPAGERDQAAAGRSKKEAGG